LPKILALPASIQVLMMTKDMKAGWPKKGASKKMTAQQRETLC